MIVSIYRIISLLLYLEVSNSGYTRVSTEDTDHPAYEPALNTTVTPPIPRAVSVTPVIPTHPLPIGRLTSNCRICFRPFELSSSDTNDPTWSRYCPDCIIGTCRGCNNSFQRPLGVDPTDGNFYRCRNCRLTGVKAVMNSCSIM